MKARLCCRVAVGLTYRTSGACQASGFRTRIERYPKMSGTGCDIIASGSESTDGAGRQARAFSAADTGAEFLSFHRPPIGQLQPFREEERASIGVPKAEARVNQRSDWGRPDRGSSPGPAQEGMMRRAAKGEDGGGSQLVRQVTQDAKGPAIQAVFIAVPILRGIREGGPHAAAHSARQHESSGRPPIPQRGYSILLSRIEGTSTTQADILEQRQHKSIGHPRALPQGEAPCKSWNGAGCFPGDAVDGSALETAIDEMESGA